MIDRIEEYRRDWDAGPVVAPKKKKLLRYTRRSIPRFVFPIVLCMAILVLLVVRWIGPLKRGWDDFLPRVKTELELTTAAKILKRHYVTNGSLPIRPEELLETQLRRNKAARPGSDFWGHPYTVQADWQGFTVFSPGSDGQLGTPDDLSVSVRYVDLHVGDR